MPREGEPRIVVRMSREGYDELAAAAAGAGVAVGGLARECIERFADVVARDVAEGRIRLRRRSGSDSASSSEVPISEPLVARRVATAGLEPGVARAIAFRRATGA